jgi:hypothetical protein
MNECKEIGKIASVHWGLGGYQDCQIGLSLTFTGNGWGVSTFIGAWAIERGGHCRWTEDDRLREIGQAGMKCAELLNKTGKTDVAALKGTPVEATFNGNLLSDWRILEEVL